LAALDGLLDQLDGFLFIGGDDYHPERYGGRPQHVEELTPERRDRFDFLLAERIIARPNLPVLGICGGMQLLCLARGGALIQDLATEWPPPPAALAGKGGGGAAGAAARTVLPHAKKDRIRPDVAEAELHAWRHPVRLAADSRLAQIVGAAEISANSYHHQAVRPERIGRGLRAVAWTADGVVGAVESDMSAPPAEQIPGAAEGRFFLGVQWHPERQAAREPVHARLFAALAAAANNR
jgi:gamma-glutamyl-gamma-aminobutyrate hydrolase PuuD